MRTLQLAILSLAIASGTAHAGAPLKLRARARWDAAVSAVLRTPRQHLPGSTMETHKLEMKAGVRTKSTRHTYLVGKQGQLTLRDRTETHFNGLGRPRVVIKDDLDRNERSVTKDHWDGSKSSELTSYVGKGRARIPSSTRTERFAADGQLASVRLDHASGLRSTGERMPDGSWQRNNTRVTRDAQGREVEKPLRQYFTR